MRPARLPIPPSRPSRHSVAARHLAAVALAGSLALAGTACETQTAPPPGPTIAFLFDGSAADADLVTSPALEGLELAARQMGKVHIEPVDVGEDPEAVRDAIAALGDDRGVLAAVVAPWTSPPRGAIRAIGSAGVPVVTLSWAWGPPEEGVWRSIAARAGREAVILLSAASAIAPEARVCLAADDDPTSLALFGTTRDLGLAAGMPPLDVVGIVQTDRTASAATVADRVATSGCPVVAWIGGSEALDALQAALDEPVDVIGTSRLKTDDGLLLASRDAHVFTVCPCVDVSLAVDGRLQRFVHDIQADSGSPPGPYAVEGYDAGRLLIGFASDGGGRRGVAAALEDVRRFRGLAGIYRFTRDGARAPEPLDVGTWQATGSRWLPVEAAPDGASG